MKPRVLLLGSAGQLGVESQKLLSSAFELTALSRAQVDLTNESQLRGAVIAANPQFIVNAAAYTAVDRAESEPALAQAVNARAPQILAESAHELNAWLLHFSTDYVFDGSGTIPWREDDPTNPLNVYGRTKLEGEQAIAATGCRHLIFRTSWVYSAHGANFLRTMLRLAAQRPRLTIVDDQRGAPTSAAELARAVAQVLHQLPGDSSNGAIVSGIYHITCAGSTSWYGFACAIFQQFAGIVPAPELVPIPTEQFPTPAARPRNSLLNCDKLERTFSIRLASWQDALTQVAAEMQTPAQ
jgi:dTDP-4-dehydrorhamnose reductase